jgi:uncharacterized protein YpmB
VYVRILIALVGIVAIFAAAAYHLASSVVSERDAFNKMARQWALERTSITQIEEIDEFRGKQSYAVVIGKNRFGTPVIAWLTADSQYYEAMERSVPKDNVIAAVKKGFPDAKLLHLVPGMDGEKRFWEATLLAQDGRYHYVYYDLYTGNVIKSYSIQSVQNT